MRESELLGGQEEGMDGQTVRLPLATLTPVEYRLLLTRESPHFAQAFVSLQHFAAEVQLEGGRLFLFGGAVRDMLLRRSPHDFDALITGVAVEEADKMIRVQTMDDWELTEDNSETYGSYKLTHQTGVDLDVRLPRVKYERNGQRAIAVNPHISLEKALSEADYTVSAIAYDVTTGELHDPHRGVFDLQNGVLQTLDTRRVIDDPKSVLRGLRLMSECGLTPDQKTDVLLRQQASLLRLIPEPRRAEEIARLHIHARTNPSGLMKARELGIA